MRRQKCVTISCDILWGYHTTGNVDVVKTHQATMVAGHTVCQAFTIVDNIQVCLETQFICALINYFLQQTDLLYLLQVTSILLQ